MQVQIRDVLRIERADVPLTGITLVAGPNGAGKSSLVAAVAAILTGEKVMGAVKVKKDFTALVRQGAKKGHIRLLNDAGEPVADMTYPAGDYSTALQPPRVSRWAAGYGLPTDLDEKSRARAFAELLGTRPTFEDLKAHMLDAKYSERSIEVIWERVGAENAIGWDETYKRAAEHSTARKGAWCEITGRNSYAPTNALEWMPANWNPSYADMDEQAIAALVTAASAEYETAMRSVGASESEIARLRGIIEQCPTPEDLAAIDKKHTDANKLLEETRAARQKLPATAAEDKLAPHCPECGAQVSVRNDLGGGYKLEKMEAISEKKRKELALKIADMDGQFSKVANEIRLIEESRREAMNRRREAASAQAQLDQLAGKAGSAEAADVARENLQKVETAFKAWKAKKDADRVHLEIEQNNKLVAILAPTGLRQRKLTEGLEKLNNTLARLSKVAGWGPVTVGDDLLLYFGGSRAAWPLVSESFEWRARATLQIALALLDGSAVVLLDQADRLEAGARQKLIMMLIEAGIPAVVGMMCSTPAGAPRLWMGNNMRVIWLDNGNGVDCQTLVKEAA